MVRKHGTVIPAFRTCGECYHYQPDSTRSKTGSCYFEPPKLLSLGDGTVITMSPEVSKDRRACGRDFSDRPKVVN